MALNFPSPATNGQTWTDPTGRQWVYDTGNNSWTAKGGASGGMVYKGGIDVTTAPPAGVQSGWLYVVTTSGTLNAGFTGLTGTIPVGSQIVFGGPNWQVLSSPGPWTRTGTELSPANAGDSVFTSGAVKVGGTTAAPNITLKADGRASIGAPTPRAGYTLHVETKADGEGIVINSEGVNRPKSLTFRFANKDAGGEIRSDGPLSFWSGDIGGNFIQRGVFDATGDFLLGGTLPASPAVKLQANGVCRWANGKGFLTYDGPSAAAATAIVVASSNASNLPVRIYAANDVIGVELAKSATAWSPITSESRLKDIQSDADVDQCWTLIRDIELKRYYYKDQDDKTGVSYMGPMADWLGVQDPELLIDTGRSDEHGPIHTYNQGLLDMKALAALSAALKRIEALEAEVKSLKAGTP
jgi:hypothetical protein